VNWIKVQIRELIAASTPGEWGLDGSPGVDTPVLRSTNIRNDGSIDYFNVAYRKIEPNRLQARRIKPGTILVEKSGGGPGQAAGRVAYCDQEFGGTASNFIEIIEVAEKYDARFVAYLLQHLYRFGLVSKYQQQTTGIINFKLHEYINEWVCVPEDQREQTEIAKTLLQIDGVLYQSEDLLTKQWRMKRGLMQDLLSRGIDKQGVVRSESTHKFNETELGKFPIEWKVSLLDSLAQRGSGHTPNKGKPTYWDGGIKWVSLADSSELDKIWIEETDKQISQLGLKNSSAVLHPKGTVILSRDAGVGKSAILADEMAVSQHFMAWRCNADRLNNVYLYYWLQRDKPKFEGIALGSTILTIGLQFFKRYKIAAPIDVGEQKAISDVLLAADEAISRTQTELAKLRSLKTAVMQDLFSGKTRVTELLDQQLRRAKIYA
jgi:type I restriction enzyme S subunit